MDNDMRDRIERAVIAIYAAHVCGTKMSFNNANEIFDNAEILIRGVDEFMKKLKNN